VFDLFKRNPRIIPFRIPMSRRVTDWLISHISLLFEKDEKWQINAIDDLAKMNDMSFRDMLFYLLACELNESGFFRGQYEPGIYRQRIKEAQKETQNKTLPFRVPVWFEYKPYFGKCKIISFEYHNFEY